LPFRPHGSRHPFAIATVAKGGHTVDSQTLTALKQFEELPDCAYVKRAVVQVLFGGISDEEVRRRTRDGRIPKPTKLGSRNNIWRVGDLRAALARLQSEAA
jgi:hypothetical protein